MLARALLAFVVVVSLVDLVLFAREGGDVPADEEYEKASRAIRAAGFSSSLDGLAVLPAWSLRPWVALGDLPKVSGDALASQPFDRYRALYVLVEPDGEDELALLAARLGAPARVHASDRVVVERFDLGGPRTVYDFRARIDDARVDVVASDGTRTACAQRPGGGHACSPKDGWKRVTSEELLVSENGDRAIWAHPPPPSERLEIAFTGVPFAKELVVRAGHTRSGNDGARASVTIVASANGREVWRDDVPVRFSFDTVRVPWPSDVAGEVTFTITTRNNAKQHWAFDAYLVGDAP